MASRLTLPSLPRIDVERLRPDPRRTVDSVRALWPTSARERKTFLWQAAFLPYWLWSDMPAPRLPERDQPLPAGGLAGDHIVRHLRSISRRTWLQRTLTILARALWMFILVAVIWLGIEIAGGPEVRSEVMPWIAVAIGLPAVVLAICSRPSNAQVARMLDRSFRLQERMVTALMNIGHDVPAPGERAGLRYLQVADAANALTTIKGNHAFRVMPPVRELVLGIICALAFASLFFLRGGSGEVPPLETAMVPEFIPAAQRFVNTPETALPAGTVDQDAMSLEQIQELAEQSNNARKDLLTLANAMEDHAFTRSAANALHQGDYEQAAATLREISEQAPGLSESERSSLASDLATAAAAMTEDGQNLATASLDAAEGLREGGSPAQEGMEGIADAIEETGASITPSETLDQAMQEAQQSQQGASNSQDSAGESGATQDSLFNNMPPDRAGQSGSQSNPGQAGSSGQAANPEDGSGSDAAAEDADRAGAEAGQGESGEGQPGAESQDPSDSTGTGGGNPFDDPSMMDPQVPASGPSESATSGGGAGTESQAETSASSGGTSGESAEGERPDPSEADVTEADAEGDGSNTGDISPGGTVTLNRAPNGQAVPVFGTGSQSSLGSGSGISGGGGGTAQGEVGDAGPDSNHVPGEYRPIVESYFSNDYE